MKEGDVITDGPWAGFEVVSAYSRAQAIEDGVLIDITDTAKKAGIEIPTAITATAFRKYLGFVFGGFSEEEKDRKLRGFS